ncbi:hypothetical protein ACNPN0_05955, partial [Glutamicibacter sp. AGC84]
MKKIGKVVISGLLFISLLAGATPPAVAHALPAATTQTDTVDPVLTSVSMKSAKTLRPGQTPTFEWVATDTSPVRNMAFWIYAPDGRIKYAYSNSSNFAGNKSTGTAQT